MILLGFLVLFSYLVSKFISFGSFFLKVFLSENWIILNRNSLGRLNIMWFIFGSIIRNEFDFYVSWNIIFIFD